MRGAVVLGAWMILAGGWCCSAEAILTAPRPQTEDHWLATPAQISDYLAENIPLPHFTKMDVNDDGAVNVRDRMHIQLGVPVTTEFPTEYTHDLFLINKTGASFVLMGADESNPTAPQFLDVIGAYDAQGHLLGVSYWHKETPTGKLGNDATVKFSLRDKFPHVHASDIAFLRINSTQRREGLTLVNGEALPGLREAYSTARFPFIVGTPEWSTEIFLANLAVDGGRFLNFLNFLNLPEQVLDGRANPWQYTTPDLRGANTGAWINFDQYFNKSGQPGGVLPDGSESARGLSELRELAGTTLLESTLSATLVRHADGRAAVLPQQRALREFLLQDVRNLESEGYQSVLTLVNDNDEDSNVMLHAFRADGFDLGSFSLLVPAHGRVEQNIADLGVPTIAKYVTARSSQPVSGFNARVSADRLVFVPPQPLNNWLYIDTVNGASYTKTLTSVDADVQLAPLGDVIGSHGRYATLTIHKEPLWDRFVNIEFQDKGGVYLGHATVHVDGWNQKSVDLETLLTEAGFGDRIAEVDHIKVYARTNAGLHDKSQNTPLNMLLETGAVERTATGVAYKDSAVRALMSTGLFDLRFSYGNDTVGFEKATDFEHNDNERMSIRGEYRGGGVTGGFKIVEVEFLQGDAVKGTRRIFDSATDGGIQRIITAEKSMTMLQSEIAAGTYDLRLKIWCQTDAGETINYLPTGKTVTASEEGDHYPDQIYHQGYSFDITKNNQEVIAQSISLDDVVYMDGNHRTYAQTLPFIQRMCNGNADDKEIVEVNILDLTGGAYGHNAGALQIISKDGQGSLGTSAFYSSSESTVQLWKVIFGVD